MSDIHDLKTQALAYFQENKVPLRMQEALNSMFKLQPHDVNGYVSNYFDELSLSPTITRVVATRSIDSKGQPAVLTKVFCVVKNREISVAESIVAYDTILTDNAKVEEKEAEDIQRESYISKAIDIINNEFREILDSANPKEQRELDTKMYECLETQREELVRQDEQSKKQEENSPLPSQDDPKKGGKKSAKGSAKKKGAQVVIVPDKPKEISFPGWHAVTAVSQALCSAGSYLNRVKKFEHLILTYGGDDYAVKLPLPMITIAQSGKAAAGKSNCIKEYMVVPRPDMPISEAVSAAAKIQDSMMKAIYAKAGISIKYMNDYGALCPTLDKPEQGLDMIADNLSNAGYEMGKDFFFVLNASAQEFFDYEKGKYEVVTGVLKAPDDMADFWGDLCNRYPSIIGIIDPVRGEEKEQWNKVCASVSSRCRVIADRVYDRPAVLKDQPLDFSSFATSGIIMRLEGANTITSLVECSKKMIDMDNIVVLSSGQHDTNDTSIVDVAIACQARYIKLGAVSRGERINKYNYLIDIESELGERKTLWSELEFPSIPPKAPTPEPEQEAEENQENKPAE